MGNLTQLHEEMLKQAAEDQATQENVNVLVKYATYAEELLEERFGDDYTEDDVEKLAEALIENDLAVEADQEKVAEYDELGRVMARGFLNELEQGQ